MSRPLQNRVLATGDIVAHPVSGRFMGNRGILHDDEQRLGRARWRHKAWVTCRLAWKAWHRKVMTPGAYTELFFLDEAVALAAGHRPCGLCRHEDYTAYRAALGVTGPITALDRILHAERAIPRTFDQKRHSAEIDTLPDGTIILDDVPKLLLGDTMYPVQVDGYGSAQRRRNGLATVLTPPLTRKALKNGYKPLIAI